MQSLIVGLIVIGALGFLINKYLFTSKKCSSCAFNSNAINANEKRM